MITKDFSKAPRYAQTEAAFFGATRYKLRGLVALPVRWIKLRRALKRSPGFLKLIVWFKFPRTIGSVVFFDTEENLMLFARHKAHRLLMQWVGDEREITSDAGFIRIFTGYPNGYANGRWSTGNKMSHIKKFTKLKGEKKDIYVDDF